VNHAFVDESARPGRYLLTAAIIPTVRLQEFTKVVRDSQPGGRRRSHMSSLDDRRRRQVLDAYIRQGIPAYVAVADYPGGDDQPARQRCLNALLTAFVDLHVGVVVLDTRGENRDRLDRRLIAAAVTARTAPTGLHYSHRGSASESLLSFPDAYGWAWGAGGHWKKRIEGAVTVITP
jgi:hypothetical protein